VWSGAMRGFTLICCGVASEAAAASVSVVDRVEKLKDATTFAGLNPGATCAYSCASPRCAPVNWQSALRVGSVMLGHVGPPEFRAPRKLA
jgi:hypothetical protein